MRNFILPLLLVVSFELWSQEIDDENSFIVPRSLIKIAPLQFFSSTLEMGIENFNADRNKSFNIDIGFRSGSADFRRGKGISTEIAYRKYASGLKMHTRKDRRFYQGIYYSVFVKAIYFKGEERYSFSTIDPVYDDQEIWNVGPGFTLGLQKTLWQIIYLDVFIGGGIKFSTYSDGGDPYFEPTITDPGYEGIYPKIGAKIGIGL